jgi:hypothetical protein
VRGTARIWLKWFRSRSAFVNDRREAPCENKAAIMFVPG